MDLFIYLETKPRHANAKFLLSREEISHPGIKPPISSFKIGYLFTIFQ